MATILVTGAAGFIGAHVTAALVGRGDTVIAVDNFNDYYVKATGDKKYHDLKERRYAALVNDKAKLYKTDISDKNSLRKAFEENKIDKICHLAAQAGVRYSLEHPEAYHQANILGTLNVLELAKDFKVSQVVFASSSSVYGGNKEIPFKEEHPTDSPISTYAATKKAGELLCHTYHHLYGLKISCLRFFTVYGPWGRPDMAAMLFADKILAGKKIQVYGHGDMQRDFTYIADITSGVLAALDKSFDYEIFNLGNNSPVKLGHFIEIIETELGTVAEKEMVDMPPGDVPTTYADICKSKRLLGFLPKTSIEEGLKRTMAWYKRQ